MKRHYLLLATLLLFCTVPMIALAEGAHQVAGTTSSIQASPTPTLQDATATPSQESTPSATDESTPAPAVVVSLAIDSLHIYNGMDRAYMDGYTPRVKNRVATVVLPLVATGSIQNNTITVTPNLGDPSSAPFVFRNYQKAVRIKNNVVGGTATVPSYLIRFDLPLKSGRINGVYPVIISIQGQATDGSVIQQSFTSYVTITDGKNPNATEPITTSQPPTSQPKIIVSGYSLDPSPVIAGKELTVTITLKNTSETQNVQNMKVAISCDSPDFSLQNDSNTIFIDRLGKGETKDIVLKYKTDLKTIAQQYNITLAIEYDNAEAVTLSSTGTVSLSVEQPLRVQMEAPQIATNVNAGDTLPITFQVMNLGRSMIYNVRCNLSAPGLIPSGTAFIGNMEAGTAKTGEMDVFVGTKDMSKGHEKDAKYGATNGTVTLIYEDESGKEYTAKTDFSTNINEPVISQPTSAPQEEPKKAGQWWVSILIGAALVIGLVVVLIYPNKRRMKKHENS